MTEKQILEVVQKVARENLIYYAKYLDQDGFKASEFHRSLYRVLDLFVKGKIRRLVVSVPPQHGKSYAISYISLSYMLATLENKSFGLVSYTASLARKFCLRVQRLLEKDTFHELFPNVKLPTHTEREYTKTASEFMIPFNGNSLISVGRGGSLTGNTLDVAIVDDLYKNYMEGNSPQVLQTVKEWFESVVMTRINNNSQICVLSTRWNENDIIGDIINEGKVVIPKTFEELEDEENIKDKWIVLNFEALKTSDGTEIDDRAQGEPLWGDMHSKQKLEATRERDAVMFDCIYQGTPTSVYSLLYPDGLKTYYKVEDYGVSLRKGAYVDPANGGNDYFAAVLYEVRKNEYGELFIIVTDIIHNKGDIRQNLDFVAIRAEYRGTEYIYFEKNGLGELAAKILQPKTNAIVKKFHQAISKEGRITTFAADVSRKIIMPSGWEQKNPDAAKEVSNFNRIFKHNVHDDFVDTLTGIIEKELNTKKKRQGISIL